MSSGDSGVALVDSWIAAASEPSEIARLSEMRAYLIEADARIKAKVAAEREAKRTTLAPGELARHQAAEPDRLKAAIDEAMVVYERQRASLYHSTGRPVWGAESHAEKEAAALATLESAIAKATDRAVALAEEHRAKIRVLEDGDALASLPTADLTRAAALAPFVKEDIEQMHAGQLMKHVQAAVDAGDVVKASLTLRYAPQRLADIRGQASGEEVLALDDLFRRLRAIVQPNRAERRAAHDAMISSAREVERHGRAVWSKATGAVERLEAQLRATGRYGRL